MLKALLAVRRVIAEAHASWIAGAAARRPLLVELSLANERLSRVTAERDLLRSRLRRLPSRSRPHYRGFERLAILEHAARHGLSARATARAFVLSAPTVSSWRRDVATDAERLVRPKSPVNKLPDLIVEVAKRMRREWPRWGSRRIAGVLARLGLKASRTSVVSFLRRPSRPLPGGHARRPAFRTVVASRPNHVWMIDFTRVGGVLRSVFVGAVIDAYSRKILSIAVAPHEPGAAFAVRLVRQAVHELGAPEWIVSDHGKQLTARSFGRALARDAIRHRYGAIARHGSLASIERTWKTFKEEYAHCLVLFRPLMSIERSIKAWVRWYNEFRPHQGLHQRTPDEAYYETSTRAASVPLKAVLVVEHLAGDRELPVLRLRRAA